MFHLINSESVQKKTSSAAGQPQPNWKMPLEGAACVWGATSGCARLAGRRRLSVSPSVHVNASAERWTKRPEAAASGHGAGGPRRGLNRTGHQATRKLSASTQQ